MYSLDLTGLGLETIGRLGGCTYFIGTTRHWRLSSSVCRKTPERVSTKAHKSLEERRASQSSKWKCNILTRITRAETDEASLRPVESESQSDETGILQPITRQPCPPTCPGAEAAFCAI